MNQPLYICVVFLFVAFVYIHVLFHLKVNNLLEVRTIQITGKEDFEEQCDRRLPFITYYNNLIMNNTFSPSHLLKNYKSFQLNSDVPEKIGEVFEKDNFLTSNNEAFLSESDTLMKINTEDNFLRPSFTCYKNYDLTMGKNSTTNFVSPLCFRTFLYICHGNIDIYLCPPKSIKFLNYTYNYETFVNESTMDPFDEATQSGDAFDRIKPLRLSIKQGELLFIPSSWYYSYKIVDTAAIITMQYRSLMNLVALTPNYINYIYNKVVVDKNNLDIISESIPENS